MCSRMDVFIDPSYEYDAPMFVDFSEGAGEIDPEADKWFGKFSPLKYSLGVKMINNVLNKSFLI